jgi:hypothetical protein
MLTARREPGEPAALQALYSHTASEVVVRYLIDSGVLYWWAWMHSTASWRVTCTQTGHVQQGYRQILSPALAACGYCECQLVCGAGFEGFARVKVITLAVVGRNVIKAAMQAAMHNSAAAQVQLCS